MLISNPEAQAIISECETRLRELTQNNSIALVPFDRSKRRKISFKRIIAAVCEATNVPFDKIKSKTKKGEVVAARHMIFFYAKQYTTMSHKSIAEHVGNRDHTASVHSIRKVNDLIYSNDSVICGAIEKIDQLLKITT